MIQKTVTSEPDTPGIKFQFFNFPGGPGKDESVKVTFLGKRIFADVIENLQMRSSGIITMGPKANGKCPFN